MAESHIIIRGCGWKLGVFVLNVFLILCKSYLSSNLHYYITCFTILRVCVLRCIIFTVFKLICYVLIWFKVGVVQFIMTKWKHFFKKLRKIWNCSLNWNASRNCLVLNEVTSVNITSNSRALTEMILFSTSI